VVRHNYDTTRVLRLQQMLTRFDAVNIPSPVAGGDGNRTRNRRFDGPLSATSPPPFLVRITLHMHAANAANAVSVTRRYLVSRRFRY